MNNRILFILIIVSVVFASCGMSTQEFLEFYPKANLAILPTAFDKPWDQRIFRVEDSRIWGLDILDPLYPRQERFYGYYYNEEEEQQILEILRNSIPSELAGLMEKYFIGIFPLFGPGTGNYLAYCKNYWASDGSPYFLLGLNMGTIRKELSSVFSTYKAIDDDWDSQRFQSKTESFQWIFVHELGHGIDHVFGFTKNLSYTQEESNPFGQAWSKAIWDDVESMKSEYQLSIPFELYGTRTLTMPEYFGILEELKASPFITYYGSANAKEDWAEMFSYYVRKNVFGHDVTLKITDPQGTVHEFDHSQSPLQKRRLEEMGEIYQWLTSQDYSSHN